MLLVVDGWRFMVDGGHGGYAHVTTVRSLMASATYFGNVELILL